MAKQVIQYDFALPSLPPDAPTWATTLLTALEYALRQIGVRLEGILVEGTEAEKPTADGTKRFYYATDTNLLYYDNGSWDQIN